MTTGSFPSIVLLKGVHAPSSKKAKEHAIKSSGQSGSLSDRHPIECFADCDIRFKRNESEWGGVFADSVNNKVCLGDLGRWAMTAAGVRAMIVENFDEKDMVKSRGKGLSMEDVYVYLPWLLCVLHSLYTLDTTKQLLQRSRVVGGPRMPQVVP